MSKKGPQVPRRRFLQTAVTAAGAAVMAPMIIPSSALGRDGAVAPSERIVIGGIGIGNRGTYDLGCFLEQKDVQFTAICDVKEARRVAVKKIADEKYGNEDCKMYRDFRELLDRSDIDAVLIATGPNWHATMAMNAARAGKDMYCEKPVTKNIAQSLILAETMRRTGRVFQAGTQRRNLPHFAFACELARTGKLGALKKVFAHPAGMQAMMSGWLVPETEPDNDAPKDGQLVARYENGTELIFRETGWIPLGSCPVRFEGETGWVEAGDSGKLVLSSPELLAGRTVDEIGGYPATYHVRDFLDCVKTRSQPKGNADAACNAHIACHAANIALHLGRQVKYDNATHQFVNDEQANRLRSEALREPWRV